MAQSSSTTPWSVPKKPPENLTPVGGEFHFRQEVVTGAGIGGVRGKEKFIFRIPRMVFDTYNVDKNVVVGEGAT